MVQKLKSHGLTIVIVEHSAKPLVLSYSAVRRDRLHWNNETVLTENLIVLMIVEVEDLVLLASSGRVRPYINDAEFPSCRASRQAAMQAEIIALRHQVTVLQRSQKSRRPVLTRMDRCFWVWLSR